MEAYRANERKRKREERGQKGVLVAKQERERQKWRKPMPNITRGGGASL